ncbi:hypothetical protein BGZ51_000642, partial [Haplosporangium sp. Z 767]
MSSTKFGSTYFAVDKRQELSPQERSFAKAGLNHNKFFVAYNILSSKGNTYCEFASYLDLPTFCRRTATFRTTKGVSMKSSEM